MSPPISSAFLPNMSCVCNEERSSRAANHGALLRFYLILSTASTCPHVKGQDTDTKSLQMVRPASCMVGIGVSVCVGIGEWAAKIGALDKCSHLPLCANCVSCMCHIFTWNTGTTAAVSVYCAEINMTYFVFWLRDLSGDLKLYHTEII